MDKNLFVDKNALSVCSSRLSPSGLSTVNFPPCDWRHNILCVPNYLIRLEKDLQRVKQHRDPLCTSQELVNR